MSLFNASVLRYDSLSDSLSFVLKPVSQSLTYLSSTPGMYCLSKINDANAQRNSNLELFAKLGVTNLFSGNLRTGTRAVCAMRVN